MLQSNGGVGEGGGRIYYTHLLACAVLSDEVFFKLSDVIIVAVCMKNATHIVTAMRLLVLVL